MSNTKIAEVVSTKTEDGKRLVKVIVMGKDDVQEIHQTTPFGIDSNPPKGTKALHVETLSRGSSVIAGIINSATDDLQVGEVRISSTDENGNDQTFITLRSDGTIEIGGDSENMVRYAPVGSTVQELQDDVNQLKQLISSWVVVPNDGGAALKAVLASWSSSPLVEDISQARIDDIKTM